MRTKTKKAKKSPSSKKAFLSKRFARKGIVVGIGVFALCCGFAGYQAWKHQQLNKVVAGLTALAAPINGVQVQTVGKAIYLMGEVASAEDWAKTRAIAETIQTSGTGISVGNLTKLSDAAKQAVVAQIKKEVRNRRVRVRSVGERFVLEGNVRSDFEADRAVEIAKAALHLDAKAPTRSTAGAGNGTPGRIEAFGPILLDMMKFPE